jgi:hypothetical protein
MARKVQPQKRKPKPGRGRARDVGIAVGGIGGLLLVVLVGAFALSKLGDREQRAIPPGLLAGDPGPGHVHGLGINPADGSLFIATHTGTWKVATGKREAERVGESHQDTMGFTVAGPNHFLGSGHPDFAEAREQSLPPLLGLIESRDGGETWRALSLSGEADFHILRFAGRRVYGYDASNDRLLVSSDQGSQWSEADRPGPLLDVAVDPGDARRLIASTETALYSSRDGGQTWSALANRVGLLGWSRGGQVALVGLDGSVSQSRDSGRTWSGVGEIGGQPAALLARSASELYVALHDGTIKRSRDGGRTWAVRSTP